MDDQPRSSASVENVTPVAPASPGARPPSEKTPPPPPRKRRSGWLWLLFLLLLGGAGYYFFWGKRPATPANESTGTGGGRRGRNPNQAAPVDAAKATRGNIGVYVTGLGAVTPIYTVTVRTQVNGQLMQVNYKEGDMVKKGDTLAEIDPRPYQAQLTQYEGQLLRDQATLENAKIDQQRYETLIKQNAVPEQQLATQIATVKSDEGIVKNDQGLIDAAKVNLTYTHITAPITGRIGLRLVDPGNIVQTSDSNGLLVITQLQPISVIFTISEDQLPPIFAKQRAGQSLPVDAFDREMKKKIASGMLTTIDNEIDQSTGTVKLRATFDNSHFELFPNQFVNARLLEQEKRGVILVPSAAVQRSSSNIYVYVVKPDSTVTVRQVQVGASDDNNTEITSGIQEGDVVVLTGVDKLQEGSKVAVNLPGAPAAAAGTPRSGRRAKKAQ
ncbi:MAG TPA: MdtA/MuxA family multidrug efflux RND transporter periplasmic adaptor subunit [Bryobacteraceae bacterium]|nr:MdtA/MuxA family multidrug efflux RND transporter periplasmic adaptor subunit [Bryobacteraceae bacterium]